NRLSPKDASVQMGGITPRYAAPELFDSKLSRQCDQYSLAIVYQELLTGTLPFAGENQRQLILAHMQGIPDLAALPDADRAVVAKALAKCPDDRYASCLEFLRALDGEAPARASRDSYSDLGIGRSADTVSTRA